MCLLATLSTIFGPFSQRNLGVVHDVRSFRNGQHEITSNVVITDLYTLTELFGDVYLSRPWGEKEDKLFGTCWFSGGTMDVLASTDHPFTIQVRFNSSTETSPFSSSLSFSTFMKGKYCNSFFHVKSADFWLKSKGRYNLKSQKRLPEGSVGTWETNMHSILVIRFLISHGGTVKNQLCMRKT